MKRYILTLLLIAISLPVVAQSQQVSGGFIRKKTTETVTIEEKVKKTYEKFDAKLGLTHIAEFNTKAYFHTHGYCHLGLSYIAGWRFNNWFLAGIGTGLDFATSYASSLKPYRAHYCEVCAVEAGGDIGGSANAVYMPLYAHARFYFTRTRWTPYCSISLGGRLAPYECGAYFDFSIGVNYLPSPSFTEKYKIGSFYATLGLNLTNLLDTGTYWGPQSHCAYKTAHEHADMYFGVGVGPSLHLGVTF